MHTCNENDDVDKEVDSNSIIDSQKYAVTNQCQGGFVGNRVAVRNIATVFVSPELHFTFEDFFFR